MAVRNSNLKFSAFCTPISIDFENTALNGRYLTIFFCKYVHLAVIYGNLAVALVQLSWKKILKCEFLRTSVMTVDYGRNQFYV